MSVVVTEENQTKVVLNQARLDKVKNLLGAKSESETLELALNRIIEEFELKNEAEESQEIDSVFDLNYGKPKRIYEIEAEFEFVGRGRPLPFDFSDVDFEDGE